MKALILGGGMSGLASAWYLHKNHPDIKITLLEKGERLGGVVQTEKDGDLIYEKGPRTFPYSRGANLLELIHEVGLSDEIITSDPKAGKRFLWHKNKLRTVGSMLLNLLPGILREPFVKKKGGDESIYDFAARRFSPKVAELIFDPVTLGVYAGDIRKLSIQSCFPIFKKWEEENGSVLKGFFSKKKSPKGKKGLFTLKNGMGSLIDQMVSQLPIEIETGVEVEEILEDGVIANGEKYEADLIISALPASVLGRIVGEDGFFSALSLWVVTLGFKEGTFHKKGYGYLAPSVEKEAVLGMIFDSFVFPQQNGSGITKFTAMVKDLGDEIRVKKTAIDAAKRHLGLKDPDFISLWYAEEAIPQFEVGYSEKYSTFEKRMEKKFPKLSIVGNFIKGASLDSTIQIAKERVAVIANKTIYQK